jgi:hypothetical protein
MAETHGNIEEYRELAQDLLADQPDDRWSYMYSSDPTFYGNVIFRYKNSDGLYDELTLDTFLERTVGQLQDPSLSETTQFRQRRVLAHVLAAEVELQLASDLQRAIPVGQEVTHG